MPYRDTELWILSPIEKAAEGEDIIGQFRPIDPSETAITNVFAELNVPGRQPWVQWMHQTSEAFNFKALFVNDPTAIESGKASQLAIKTRNALKRAMLPVRSLGRPAKYTFSWGDIQFDCFIVSIGPIQYTELDWQHSQHAATFDISLRVLADDKGQVIINQPAEKVSTAAENTTYEQKAKDENGDPMSGVKDRQNSKIAFPLAATVMSTALAAGSGLLYRETGVAPKAGALAISQGNGREVLTQRQRVLAFEGRAE